MHYFCLEYLSTVVWYNASYSWAYKERELNSRVSAVAKSERKLGEIFSLLYSVSSYSILEFNREPKLFKAACMHEE